MKSGSFYNLQQKNLSVSFRIRFWGSIFEDAVDGLATCFGTPPFYIISLEVTSDI